MSGLFITGTDTDAGKTLVCGYLAGFLRAQGVRVVTQKWVQTGCADGLDDLQLHRAISGLAVDPELAHLQAPYRFALAASPHLAAAAEGATIDPAVIAQAYLQLAARFELVLAEGAGGALVPLTEELLTVNLAAQLGLPALLVVRNGLGCINHALLTIEALRQRNIPLLGVIFTRVTASGDPRILDDNIRIIGALAGVQVFGELPYLADPLAGAAAFAPIGHAFLDVLMSCNLLFY